MQALAQMYITLFTCDSKLKAPDRCAQLFDRERSLITDKHTEVLDCISCVMVFFLSTDRQTDRQTDATKRIISLASRSIITCGQSGAKMNSYTNL